MLYAGRETIPVIVGKLRPLFATDDGFSICWTKTVDITNRWRFSGEL